MLWRLFTSLWVRKEREKDLDSGLGYNAYRPEPTDSLLPEKPHFLLAPQPSQIIPPPGEQAFRSRACVGNFRFRSQQYPHQLRKNFMTDNKNIHRTEG